MAKPVSIAHRGGRGLWAENTLFAFRHAIDLGVDGAELDVQLTRDGALIVAHDFRIGPALYRKNGAWSHGDTRPICDVTLADLRAFDVGRTDPASPYHHAFPQQQGDDGERVPLFAELLDLIGARDFRLLVEIKTAWNDRTLSAAPEAVADAVLAALREKNFLDRATLVSFDWTALIHACKNEPEIPCWYLTLPVGNEGWRREAEWAAGFEPSKFGGIQKAIAAVGGEGWLAFYADASADAVCAAHDLGLKVGVWNVNDVAGIRDFASRGVDAICSDYPDRLIAALSK